MDSIACLLPNLLPFVAHEVLADLCSALPPLDNKPEALDTRDRLARVAVAGLLPIDVFEALSAADRHRPGARHGCGRQLALIRLESGLTPAAMAELARAGGRDDPVRLA